MVRVGRILIVGAGIGGLGAGTVLARLGIEVDLVEVRPDGAVLGIGINQPANSLRALRSIGVLEECLAVGYQFRHTRFHTWRGELIVDIESRLGGDGVPANNALPRPQLHRILTAAAEDAGAKIQYGTTVTHLATRPGRVEAGLSNGATETYDLVLGFDGIGSVTRRAVFGDRFEPVYSGCGAWRVPCPRPSEVTCTQVFQGIASKAGLLPLSREAMYLFAISKEPGNPHHDPGRLHELLRERLAGYTGLVGEICAGLTEHSGVVYSPMSEVMLPPPWYAGRVLILGDAAHAAMPHLTQGAAMALEDAVVLGAMLGEDRPVPETLAAFVQRRYPRVKLVQDVSHGILVAEVSTTAQTMPDFQRRLATELPSRMAVVEGILNQPA
jgi:2-polyprenyl-6-methoxyphenol hydroxylase-like FAD-dependent oxidoreductase